MTLASTFGLMLSSTASAVPPADPPPAGAAAAVASTAAATDTTAAVDDLPSPAEDERRALRQQAITGVLNGTITPEVINGSTVAKVGSTEVAATAANGRRLTAPKKAAQYVELSRQKTDRIFVILAEFGNERSPNYPDQDTNPNIPGPAVFDGPLVNQIPQPDPSKDNSTIWQQNFSRAHFQQTYFGTGPGVESLKTYYEKQSSGRYSVDGEVTD